MAAELDWDSIDPDLINQIGEGGIETRSECELITVLTFHHDSLIRELEGASRDVQTGMAEGWVAAPVPDLPFVPCRMQPRGVVMQARSRVGEDGKLEEYLKPRITTDNSFGGIDSCNAAVAGSERAIELPSAQSLGRGWAICQSAFDNAPADEGGGTPVGGYCIDAESAYRFCPVQQADWWQQVFCWWDAEGNAGFAVDTRMGFGGAFAPNRFERVSTLVCAVAATMQSAFDAEQPPPICARRWKEDRRRMQADGTLPAGRFQADPAYIQSFIDDFTGCASTDIVVPPPEVAEVAPDLPNMLKAGCIPPHCNTRLFVHAQLTVLALRRVGLVAAPAKVMIGSPLPALGLRFDGARRTIDCPEGKQRAVVAACEQAAEHLTSTGEVDRVAARRLVGRLCNLSQVAPELRYHLHGGYAVTEVSWTARGTRVFEPTVKLKRGSVPHSNWTGLLATAITGGASQPRCGNGATAQAHGPQGGRVADQRHRRQRHRWGGGLRIPRGATRHRLPHERGVARRRAAGIARHSIGSRGRAEEGERHARPAAPAHARGRAVRQLAAADADQRAGAVQALLRGGGLHAGGGGHKQPPQQQAHHAQPGRRDARQRVVMAGRSRQARAEPRSRQAQPPAASGGGSSRVRPPARGVGVSKGVPLGCAESGHCTRSGKRRHQTQARAAPAGARRGVTYAGSVTGTRAPPRRQSANILIPHTPPRHATEL